MGANRSGARWKQRRRRAKREQERIARKYAQAETPAGGSSVTGKVVAAVEGAAAAVGKAVKAVAGKVKDAVS